MTPLQGATRPGKGRVLVMDDEELLREIIGQLLEVLGYQAGFAKNGEEAIKVYEKLANATTEESEYAREKIEELKLGQTLALQ